MAGDFILQVADKKMVKEVLTSSMIVYFLYCKRIKFQNRTVLKNLLKKKTLSVGKTAQYSDILLNHELIWLKLIIESVL